MRRRKLLLSEQRFLTFKKGSPPSLLALFGPLRFILVSENETEAKRASFQDVTEIHEQLLTVLHPIRKSQFQRCFQQNAGPVA
jgi:hypothetical protein